MARTAPSAPRTGRIPMPKLLNLFSNRSIAAKLAALTIVGAIWQIADGFQQAAAAGKMTEEEAKTRFYAVASSIWYEGHTNYVFIYDAETGICVANPGVPTLFGKDMRSVKDANGLPFASMMIDIARQGGAGSSIRYKFLRSSTDPTPLEQGA